MISDSSSTEAIEPDCEHLISYQSHASDSDASKENPTLPEQYCELEDSVLEEVKNEKEEKEETFQPFDTTNQAQASSTPQNKPEDQPQLKPQKPAQPVQETQLQPNQSSQVEPKQSPRLPSQILKVDLSSKLNRRDFMMTPCLEGYKMQCTILQYGSVYDCQIYGCDFTMRAKKKGFPARSFVIDLCEGAYTTKPKFSSLGKIKFNGKKTEFDIYSKKISINPSNLGFVKYEAESAYEHKSFKAYIPIVDNATNTAKSIFKKKGIWKKLNEGDHTQILELHTKLARWDPDRTSYRLRKWTDSRINDSTKSFQLIDDSDDKFYHLQFGPHHSGYNDRYCFMIEWPLSPFQAFAICMTTFA